MRHLSLDLCIQELVHHILASGALKEACVLPFDTGRMWKSDHGGELREQLQFHFQNITGIMDCVGCEKCKLWGKLQFLGVATALKVLFAESSCLAPSLPPSEMLAALKLERNEAIALINLLSKLSQSVAAYRSLSEAALASDGLQPCYVGDDIIA
jgi:ERO1-like protein alpha